MTCCRRRARPARAGPSRRRRARGRRSTTSPAEFPCATSAAPASLIAAVSDDASRRVEIRTGSPPSPSTPARRPPPPTRAGVAPLGATATRIRRRRTKRELSTPGRSLTTGATPARRPRATRSRRTRARSATRATVDVTGRVDADLRRDRRYGCASARGSCATGARRARRRGAST